MFWRRSAHDVAGQTRAHLRCARVTTPDGALVAPRRPAPPLSNGSVAHGPPHPAPTSSAPRLRVAAIDGMGAAVVRRNRTANRKDPDELFRAFFARATAVQPGAGAVPAQPWRQRGPSPSARRRRFGSFSGNSRRNPLWPCRRRMLCWRAAPPRKIAGRRTGGRRPTRSTWRCKHRSSAGSPPSVPPCA